MGIGAMWQCGSCEAFSNYRKLKNLVDGLEEMVCSGRVKDATVFLFTDNSSAQRPHVLSGK
jgi:hypothetical protein